MYKVIFGAKRKAGMSREDFARYWLTTHADKGRNSPGLVRYVVNIAPDLTGGGRELPYDGFAESWFESLDDMRISAQSPEWQEVLADEPNLFDVSTRFMVVVEENVIVN